jgi:hypothetical protein
MFCTSCGKALENGALFCPACGARTKQAYVTEVKAAQPPVTGVKTEPKPVTGIISKKAIVFFSIAALILTVLFVTVVSMYYLVAMRSNIFRFYMQNFTQLINLTYPPIIAGLFVLFCALLDKKTPLLTGIPRILWFGISLFLIFIQAVFLKYSFNVLEEVFYYLFMACFIVFYMLTVAGKFGSGNAGKILTIIFGGLVCLMEFIFSIEYVVLIFKLSGTPYLFLLWIGDIIGSISVIVTIFTMVLIVFHVSASKANQQRT